ncbi:hypothetical protein [Nocardioides sp. SR21]|uniref:hypothetical protein n=1 Tax=Nocardioides sp. SR21 TaxID=2919501 RepID=UPI001FAB2065|nr:hypothetical protein [Nocardioides sp. SR21]
MQVWRSPGHRVEADLGFRRTIRWFVDDELVAERTSADEKIRLEAEAGHLEVRFSALGQPRRATLLDDDLDLVPEPGSSAAVHEEKVRAHPTRYAAIATVVGVAKVVVPIVATVLLARFTLPHLRLDLDLPRPDLPSLPVPDLPSPPLPDLPDVSLPEQVRWVLEHSKYVWPVVLAFVLARAEINRRRRQDERREGDDQSRS